MATLTLYGIKNCDTVKKARKWLEGKGLEYQFHDFREQGLTATTVKSWLSEQGVDTLINKRSTTWKQLSEAEKAQIMSGDIIDIVLQNPTLIKRPVLSYSNGTQVGFSDKNYTEILG